MKIDREKADFLDEMIDQWERDKNLSPEKATELKRTYHIKSFDWQKVAQY